VFRWPVEFTPLSLSSQGQPRAAVLEITPRGAIFTLAALSHVGHPAHLALIDAYLKGQVRLTPTASIGEDCRLVASSLAAPLLAAFELGIERLSLADLVLRDRSDASSRPGDRAIDGHPVFTQDSSRLLLQAGGLWHWVHVAERFEAPGCLGTRNVGLADQWHRVIAQLPSREDVAAASVQAGYWPAPILAEVREPTGAADPVDRETVERLRAYAHPGIRSGVRVAEADGYQTLWLLPAADADPANRFETMCDLAWDTIEGLIGRPLPERRTEPIALRLIADDGLTVTLDIGVSVVIGRNQVVFAAWVGSDGRVMLKLFPPGGMPTR
jgi:hypothetical protein